MPLHKPDDLVVEVEDLLRRSAILEIDRVEDRRVGNGRGLDVRVGTTRVLGHAVPSPLRRSGDAVPTLLPAHGML